MRPLPLLLLATAAFSACVHKPPIMTVTVRPHALVSSVLAPPIHVEARVPAPTGGALSSTVICFEAEGPDFYSSACEPVSGPLMTATLVLPTDGKYEVRVTLYNLTGDEIASAHQEVDVGVTQADISPPEPEFNLTR